MNLESYTSDAICQAMRLGQFVDPRWLSSPASVMRILLTPSFHPEICLTFTRQATSTLVSVVALAEQMWTHPEAVHRTCFIERVELPADAFEELGVLFGAALAATCPANHVCIDGMGFDSCLVKSAGVERVSANVALVSEYTCFARRTIEMAWGGCKTPRIRNTLADAGIYLNLKYARQHIPAEKPAATVAVLGVTDERHDFLNTLSQVKRERKP